MKLSQLFGVPNIVGTYLGRRHERMAGIGKASGRPYDLWKIVHSLNVGNGQFQCIEVEQMVGSDKLKDPADIKPPATGSNVVVLLTGYRVDKGVIAARCEEVHPLEGEKAA